MRDTYQLEVHKWEPSSDSENDGRLYATVEILGTLHHLEAVPVRYRVTDDLGDPGHAYHEQGGASEVGDSVYDEYYTAFGADGHFNTVEIEGKEYALFMSPFCH